MDGTWRSELGGRAHMPPDGRGHGASPTSACLLHRTEFAAAGRTRRDTSADEEAPGDPRNAEQRDWYDRGEGVENCDGGPTPASFTERRAPSTIELVETRAPSLSMKVSVRNVFMQGRGCQIG